MLSSLLLNELVDQSSVLPGETAEGGVEHIEEHLIVVKIIPPVCKGTSGSEAALERVNHLAPFLITLLTFLFSSHFNTLN